MKHANEVSRFLKDGDFEVTNEGLLIHKAIMAKGKYYHSVNGKDEQVDENLVPAEGILHFLDVTLGFSSKEAAWYLALFSGNVTPSSTWTAANFAANATENVSQTEGFSGTVRPTWNTVGASAGKIGNLASRASYTIVCTTSVTFYGAGLLSAQTRGATSGILASASRFSTARTLNNADVFELGYEVELTDS